MKCFLILGCTVALVFLAQTAVAESNAATEEIAQTRTVLKENKLTCIIHEESRKARKESLKRNRIRLSNN